MSNIDEVYTERNQLVGALSKIYPAYKARHEGGDWMDDWRNIIYITLPTGQVSWHIHDSEMWLFEHLAWQESNWDGHDTSEKYFRLNNLPTKKPPSF
jgi:hypothetical protein